MIYCVCIAGHKDTCTHTQTHVCVCVHTHTHKRTQTRITRHISFALVLSASTPPPSIPLHRYPSLSPCVSACPSPTQAGWMQGACTRVSARTLPAGGSSREGCSLGKWRTVCSLLLLENCLLSLSLSLSSLSPASLFSCCSSM